MTSIINQGKYKTMLTVHNSISSSNQQQKSVEIKGGNGYLKIQPLNSKQNRPEISASLSIVDEIQPISFYHPDTIDAEIIENNESNYLYSKNVLFVTDKEYDKFSLNHKNWDTHFLTSNINHTLPTVTNLSGEKIDVEKINPEEKTYDHILFVLDGQHYDRSTFLSENLDQVMQIMNYLFHIVKQHNGKIESGKLSINVIVENSWCKTTDSLNAISGFFGGFIKSLARDYINAQIKLISIDKSLFEYFDNIQQEVSYRSASELPEVYYKDFKRSVSVLGVTQNPGKPDGSPGFPEGSVILATGGARGATAAIVEYILATFNVTVIALGRTELKDVPEDILRMDMKSLQEYEAQFYREQLTAGKTRDIKKLKRLFSKYQAANEIFQNETAFSSLTGNFQYISTDITNPQILNRTIAEMREKYGNITMVIHGAGTQISKSIPKKTVKEFNSVVSAKLIGLRNIYQSLDSQQDLRKTKFHILTSAFSFWGNDGQPDYGAANEAMTRLAATMNNNSSDDSHTNWTTLAWLGWASIGMTRGSEYAALAIQRKLFPVTKPMGQRVFSKVMDYDPQFCNNIIATPGELSFYNVPTKETKPTLKILNPGLILDINKLPYLNQHLVNNVPTMPGAMEVNYAAISALEFSEKHYVIGFKKAQYKKLLRSHAEKPTLVRIKMEMIENTIDTSIVRVTFLSDFIHKSGRVLAKDIENFQVDVICSNEKENTNTQYDNNIVMDNVMLENVTDPYIAGTGSLTLNGIFDCIRDISISRAGQKAKLVLPESLKAYENPSVIIPSIVFDAIGRLSVIREENGKYPLYVPIESGEINIFFDYADAADLYQQCNELTVVATKPVPIEGIDNQVLIKRVVAYNRKNQQIVNMKEIIANRMN